MKVLHLAHGAKDGGAARALQRLRNGLQHLGLESQLLSMDQEVSPDCGWPALDFECQFASPERILAMKIVQEEYFDKNRKASRGCILSWPYPGPDLTEHPAILEADILNPHWIARFQTPATFAYLLAGKKPVVWTLHDLWACTGGCHFTNGCDKFHIDCLHCPQLIEDPYCIPNRLLKEKENLWRTHLDNLVLAAPSRWLADEVRRSHLFRNCRIEKMANGIDTDIFRSVSQQEARVIFSLPIDATVIVCGSVALGEHRKGGDLLPDIFARLLENPKLRPRINEGKVWILIFGYPHNLDLSFGIPWRSTGFIDNDSRLAQAYSAGDVFMITSREENLPNTVMEAMACSRAVVGFSVGGCPEMIEDGVTGHLVSSGDVVSFSDALSDVLLYPDKAISMGEAGRKKVLREYALVVMAGRYHKLFHELITKNEKHEKMSNAGKRIPLTPISVQMGPDLEGACNKFLNNLVVKNVKFGRSNGYSKDRIERLDDFEIWLSQQTNSEGLIELSPPRRFAHNEEDYDKQYPSEPIDLAPGRGLLAVLRERSATTDGPALELGCGTGRLTVGIAAEHNYSRFLATDMSPAFLRIVHGKLQSINKINDKVILGILDGDRMENDLPKGHFALVTFTATLHHILFPEQFIHSVASLLLPGGYLAFHEPCREGNLLIGLLAECYPYFRKSGKRDLSFFKPKGLFSRVPCLGNKSLWRANAELLARTQHWYARRDVDKRKMEDKHQFLPEEVIAWGKQAGLDMEFIPNKEFAECGSQKQEGAFSIRHYIKSYIRYCMGMNDEFVNEFEEALNPAISYLERSTAGGPAPAFHGIFIGRKIS